MAKYTYGIDEYLALRRKALSKFGEYWQSMRERDRRHVPKKMELRNWFDQEAAFLGHGLGISDEAVEALGKEQDSEGELLTKPCKCWCGYELPWHLVGVGAPKSTYVCSCSRSYAWVDKNTLKYTGVEHNPFAE